MIVARKRNLKFSIPKFHKKYFWTKYTVKELKQNFVKVCAFERNGSTKYKAYYWKSTRMEMVKYFEMNFGKVPEILKYRRMPKDPFLPSMDKEFKSWLNTS